MSFIYQQHHETPHSESHWIPLSDLMTGLMMMFLLIAVLYMVQVEAQSQKIRTVAVLYEKLRDDLYADLSKEFKDDLARWGAELRKSDLAVQFKEPDVLFAMGSSDLRPRFRAILDDFFPRYVAILTSPKYRDSITEVRIEGHTSSIWTAQVTERESYFLNMALSQARTRSTLEYVMTLPSVAKHEAWLRQYLTANGLSFSKLVKKDDGSEDLVRSQRVEFRVLTNAEERIARILETS